MIELKLELQYFIILSGLLLLPKIFLRFRVPSAITAIFLGVITAAFLGWFKGDDTISLLATLGITSLFLFAGLELNMDEIRKDAKPLAGHLFKSLGLLFVVAYGLHFALKIPFRASLILSLGLMTPSTGFILHSLNAYDFSDSQKYWIRLTSISKEIMVLGLLFFILQSSSFYKLSISVGVILGLIVFLPILFRFFLSKVAPYAPDSEVAFLILIALLCGVITKELGTYYLIGAFVVGVVAGKFKHFINYEKSERMFYAVGFFFSFFVPFYFFRAGLNLADGLFSHDGIVLGLIFLAVFLPLRYVSVILSIWYFKREFWKDRFEISLSLLPTLIFGLVISSILRERFNVPDYIPTALVIYTMVSSVVPALLLKKAPPEEYDTGYLKQK